MFLNAKYTYLCLQNSLSSASRAEGEQDKTKTISPETGGVAKPLNLRCYSGRRGLGQCDPEFLSILREMCPKLERLSLSCTFRDTFMALARYVNSSYVCLAFRSIYANQVTKKYRRTEKKGTILLQIPQLDQPFYPPHFVDE